MAGIDTDFFINAYSKGLSDAAKTPSMFSAFTNSFISGLDDERKAEKERQDAILRQNEIDQLSVTNRIHEAQADAADMAVAGYRRDPEGYTQAAVHKQQEADAEYQLKIRLDQLESQYNSDMQSGDPKLMAQATLGGKYSELYGAKPHLYDAAEKTYSLWDASDQQALDDMKRVARTKDLLGSRVAKAQADFDKSESLLFDDPYLAQLKNKLGTVDGKDLNDQDILERGKVEWRTLPKLGYVPVTKPAVDADGKPITGPNGKPIYQNVTDEKGETVYEMQNGERVLRPSSEEGAPLSKQRVFTLDGNIVDYDVDPDFAKNFTRHQGNWKILNGLEHGQGGLTDYHKQAKQVQEKKISDEAAQEEAARADYEKQAEYERRFKAGMSVENPNGLKVKRPYQDAANNLDAEIRANREEAQPKPTPEPRATFDPQSASYVLNITKEPPVVPPGVQTPEQNPYLGPGGAPTPSPAFGPGGEPMSSPTPFSYQEPSPQPTVPPEEINRREKEALAQAKGKFYVEQIASKNPQLTPEQEVLRSTPPAQQAKETVAPRIAKAPIQVIAPVPTETPSPTVIQRVTSIPGMKNQPAIIKAVAAAESAGKPNAKSGTDVVGLMQTQASTAREVIQGGIDRTDPFQSLRAGGIYLMSQLRNFDNPLLALVAYNAGPGVAQEAVRLAGTTEWSAVQRVLPDAVEKYFPNNKKKRDETLNYVYRVLPYFAHFATTRADQNLAEKFKDAGVIRF